MPKKIAFIGAGSVTFTRNLVRDILTFPAFADCTLALMDIDQRNLDRAKAAVDAIVAAGQYPAKVIATLNRAEALDGADGVLTTIQVGGADPTYTDVAIPKQYGMSYVVGDTRGPAAIFRFLRTLPQLMDILNDIEKYCPKAVYLNYTNPMAMLCKAMQTAKPQIMTSGLCHSVQGTAEMLARWIGAPMDEITFTCAGINHQAHYLEYKWKGEDAYPLIHKAITENPAIYNEEIVRNEMYLHLGYYVTESSGHNSEYNWWFRKRPDLIERYCHPGTGWNPGFDRMDRLGTREEALREYQASRDKAFHDFISNPIDLARGHEYAAYIFNGVFGDNAPFQFNGNVRNMNLIDNLPYGSCVEVPMLASRTGLQAMHVGALPPQLAALNGINAACEDLAVEGYFERDRRKIYWACLEDPLAATMCSMSEIQSMVDDLFAAQKEWIDW